VPQTVKTQAGAKKAAQISIVSGYFNPLHVGHLDMMYSARALTGFLLVIVNNDDQQIGKKGKVIQPTADRIRIVRELRVTDEAVEAIDSDQSVRATLALIRERYPDARLIFANGGDDRSDRSEIREADVCEALGIELVFGVGGESKADSSSRINSALGAKLIASQPN
jgi:glycerol-3-phosphate cytidylyltransferase/D-beta-D-heptose 7-phosphate kinase/D-beta-D-heptose 1-phosphate adenosyltransferase